MKKYIGMIFTCLVILFTCVSCDIYTGVTTQDDVYVENDIVRTNVDFNIIIRYGRPYYYEGSLLYYVYNDLYYYPFYYNNYWYVRAYRRPFNHLYYRPYFRPHRYDYKFAPGQHRGFDRPHNPPRPRLSVTPRPGRSGMQPSQPSRPSTRPMPDRPSRSTVTPSTRSRSTVSPTPSRPSRSTVTPSTRSRSSFGGSVTRGSSMPSRSTGSTRGGR